MPAFFGEITTLKYLFLAFNERLTVGTIPIEYSSLVNLVDLSLQSTNRIGPFPVQFETLENLVLLDLNSNVLTGSLPTQIGRMTALKFLLLQHNKLEGSIPSTLSALVELDTLVVDGNSFTAGDENICAKGKSVLTSVATCNIAFPCACCTMCCSGNDTSCSDLEWFSDVDPIAEGGYVREDYTFHESDIVFPVPQETASYYQNYSGYYNTGPIP
jgi:hypothetical protein